MKMKRIVSLCLSFLLLTSVAVAAETPAATEPSYEITVTKAMAFAVEYAGWLYAALGELSVNGTAVELAEGTEPFVQDGKLMIPLRLVVEALGGKTEWDRESRTIQVLDAEGQVLYALNADESTYYKESGVELDLMVPAVLKDGTTFLAAEDVLRLQNLKLEVR